MYIYILIYLVSPQKLWHNIPFLENIANYSILYFFFIEINFNFLYIGFQIWHLDLFFKFHFFIFNLIFEFLEKLERGLYFMKINMKIWHGIKKYKNKII